MYIKVKLAICLTFPDDKIKSHSEAPSSSSTLVLEKKYPGSFLRSEVASFNLM
jgi:hypothetical protein